MKANSKKWKLIFATALILSAGRAFAETHIEGEWAAQSKSGVMMTLHFFSDGLWDFDINGDVVKDMWGKFKVSGDTVSLTTTGGKEVCPSSKKPGKYTIQLNGPQLNFIEISDSCAPRAENFSLFWTMQ